MIDTKEKILHTALRLFAKDGYEGVSVSMIAKDIGITKSALYKHYKNKRDIFDSILKRMSRNDYERAKEYEMPAEPIDEGKEPYQSATPEEIAVYSKAQFRYWTQDKFASDFRKMLTLEQYRSNEMSALYHQYLAGGPLDYMADIFGEMLGSRQDAMQAALEFYGPMFILYGVYDSADNKSEILTLADRHIDNFIARLNKKIKSEESK